MFEGWATEYLASYLGHFCDLQKEQLRISLWRGEFAACWCGAHPDSSKGVRQGWALVSCLGALLGRWLANQYWLLSRVWQTLCAA